MSKQNIFFRRISAEEVKKGYIFVLKDKLSFFPATGKSFQLHSGNGEKQACVESYHCECRGPRFPHDHYFIRWEGLRFGDKISIEKDSKTENAFRISIIR